MSDIVILSATRTPLGSFQGAYTNTPAAQLGATAIRGAVAQAKISPDDVSDVLMGNVLQAGQGQAPARQAALADDLPESVRTVTVHKVCGSGMQAVMQGAHALGAGMGSVIVAGGMENMTLAPYLMPKARDGYRIGHQQVIDSLVTDGLWDPYNNIHMGNCAEKCAEKYTFTREEQDAYAIESFKRANAAQQEAMLRGTLSSAMALSEATTEWPTTLRSNKSAALKKHAKDNR
jgi:acetyl-CoA C-acetyltransferase